MTTFTEHNYRATAYTAEELALGCLYGVGGIGGGFHGLNAEGEAHGWRLVVTQTYGVGNRGTVLPIPVTDEAKIIHRVAQEAWLKGLMQTHGSEPRFFCPWLAKNKVTTPPGFTSVEMDIVVFTTEPFNRFEPNGAYYLVANFARPGLEHLADHYKIYPQYEDDE